ncbi:aconitase X swivel domain-containing protein [Terrilactibacillus laevilacticus]|uniref:Aconitase X swivel domain-containing protein n=1 Tax=Terrilactibacillus laevilacticus TaxID=1380157 RepID=A0ABW5PNI8_9BACI|nr:DUF126 domain-containing protein [Terrilactibacillus laevilacticus]
MTTKQVYPCHKISEGVCAGEVLFSKDDMMFYLCDPVTGKVIEENHCLNGQSVSEKILVFPSGKGSSVVQTDGLYQLVKQNNAPKAVIVEHPDTVLVSTCIILGIPMVDQVDEAFYQCVKNGESVRLNTEAGTIEVISVSHV